MLNTPNIPAGRYQLRKLEPDDSLALFATFSSEAECRFLSHTHFTHEADLRAWLMDPDWNGRSWVAVDTYDNTVVGRFVAVPSRDNDVTEIGYITVSNRQGLGIAQTCAAGLITYLFEQENKRRVFLEIDSRNEASIAIAERLGFTREACLREHERTHNGLCDALFYGLLRREWNADYSRPHLI